MLTSDPSTFLDRAAALDQIAEGQATAVRQFQVAARGLAEAQDAARQEAAAAAAVERRMADRRAAIERSLRAVQALLAQLQPLERAHLRQAEQAQDRVISSRAPAPPPAATPKARGSGRGSVAVRFAYAQLGKPYHWGSSGPGSYDCSGLTMAAWAAAGVHLPHSSGAQFGSGTHLPFSALIPGDLVFYGHPIHHVGIHVGSGMMISSPHTGTVVKIQSAARGDFAGAVRP